MPKSFREKYGFRVTPIKRKMKSIMTNGRIKKHTVYSVTATMSKITRDIIKQADESRKRDSNSKVKNKHIFEAISSDPRTSHIFSDEDWQSFIPDQLDSDDPLFDRTIRTGISLLCGYKRRRVPDGKGGFVKAALPKTEFVRISQNALAGLQWVVASIFDRVIGESKFVRDKVAKKRTLTTKHFEVSVCKMFPAGKNRSYCNDIIRHVRQNVCEVKDNAVQRTCSK